MLNSRDWTQEQVMTLTRMWGEGYSASQIAHEMPGRTRNSIIGKVSRLGLPARATNVYPIPRRARLDSTPRPQGYKNARQIAQEAVWLPLENTTPVTLLDRKRSQCAWPLDLPHAIGAGLVCGEPVHREQSYCAAHCRAAYLPRNQKNVGWRA